MWRAHDLTSNHLKPAPRYTQPDWASTNRLVTTRSELHRMAANHICQDLQCTREDATSQICWATRHTKSNLCCRVEELKLWKSLMADSVTKVDQEICLLEQVKAKAETCLQETSLHRQILGECVVLRDGRLGGDLVHDHVGAQLSTEVELCEHIKHLSQQRILELQELLRTLKNKRSQLLYDQTDKDEATKLNSQCLELDLQSPSVGYRYQLSSATKGALTYEQWKAHCKNLKESAERLIIDSSYSRSSVQHVLSELVNALRTQRSATDFSLRKRLDELSRAKDTLEWEKQQVMDAVEELRAEMRKVEGQILVSGSEEQLAQARLDVLAQRGHCELCLDQPYTGLMQETKNLCRNTFSLKKKFLLSQKILDTMYRNLFSLEEGLKEKAHSLEIDHKCQEVCRHLLGLHSMSVKPVETVGIQSPSQVKMGCGSSKITAVEPVKPGNLDENETVTARGGNRGDSAVSKKTTDSGVGLDTGESSVLPGAVPRILPPLRAQSPGLDRDAERPDSSVILEQLLSQGIIPAQPKVGGGGEAYNIMLDNADKPRRRPPPRLESLKTRKEQEVTSKEVIEEKMRQVEERRKVREEELRSRLRAKSARPRGAAPAGGDVEEAPPDGPLHTAHPQPQAAADQEPCAAGSGGGQAADGRSSDSPELENDSTFQKSEDGNELF